MSVDQDQKSIPLKGEEGLLLDHNYDGILELDYPLPKWWIWLFYITIVFAVFYAGYYMVGPGPTLNEELSEAMAKIEAMKPVASPGGENTNSDEALLALAAQADKVELGKGVFTGKCTPCHGDKGQGVIGPNLTDDYWLHGTGRPSEIAKVIQEGVPEKGMPPWAAMLSDDELKNVAAFIVAIHGSNPPGAKEPQGELHVSPK